VLGAPMLKMMEMTKRRSVTGAIGVVAVAAVVLVAMPRQRDLLVPHSGVLFGAYVRPLDSFADEAKRTAVNELEASLGRTLAVDHHYYPWDSPFPGANESFDVAAGRVPMVSWHGIDTAAIRSGSQDALIRERAQAVKDLGNPIFMRWGWEMDGTRNQWWVVSPASYIAAWIHIHRIFDQVGATNVVWVWCPSAEAFDDRVASSYYPGNAYVDWVCADGYNWAPAKPGTSWRSFGSIFTSFYDWAKQTGKPIMIGETGVLEADGDQKASWLADIATTLRTRMPLIKAFLYFSSLTENGGIRFDWRTDTSLSSAEAFAALAHDPVFAGRAP
jgi:hypothetical protein